MKATKTPYHAGTLCQIPGLVPTFARVLLRVTGYYVDVPEPNSFQLVKTGTRLRDPLGYYMLDVIGERDLIVHVHESKMLPVVN